jgi:hypothetical protein
MFNTFLCLVNCVNFRVFIICCVEKAFLGSEKFGSRNRLILVRRYLVYLALCYCSARYLERAPMFLCQSDALDKASCQKVVQNKSSQASANGIVVNIRGYVFVEWVFQVNLGNCFPGYDGVIEKAEVNAVDTHWVCVGIDIGLYASTLSCSRSIENVSVSNTNALSNTGL